MNAKTLGLLACLIGCSRAPTSTPAPRASSVPAPVVIPDPQEQLRLSKQHTAEQVEAAWNAFLAAVADARGKCNPISPTCEAAASVVFDRFRSLVEIVDLAAETVDVAKYRGAEYDIAKVALSNYDALMSVCSGYERNPPQAPVKPEYVQPRYHGAYTVSGSVRGNYKGDLVVQSGNDYYVIENGSWASDQCNGWWSSCWFVEGTGRTVSLDIGRNGRLAEVVSRSSRETYQDDHEAYNQEVASARSDYNQALVQYRADLASNGAAQAKHAADKRNVIVLANKLSGAIGAYYNARRF